MTFLKLLLVAAAAATPGVVYGGLTRTAAYRRAHDHAGDLGLPGAQLWPTAASVTAIVDRLHEAADAYRAVLRADDLLALLTLGVFLTFAFLAYRRLPSSLWALTLFVPATLAAASDWAENRALRRLLDAVSPADALAAAWATRAKWVFLGLGVVIALVVILRLGGRLRAWRYAVFLDVPFLVDSATSRLDFNVHKEYRYDAESGGGVVPRSVLRRPALWLFAATVVFASFGPVWDGLCTVVPPWGPRLFFWGGGLASATALGWIGWQFRGWLRSRLAARFADPGTVTDGVERRRITTFVMGSSFLLLLAPPVVAGIALATSAIEPGLCAVDRGRVESLAATALCAIAIAILVLVWRRWRSTPGLMWLQAALLTVGALGHWWLAGAGGRAANQEPYRHVFGVAAPVFVVVTVGLAPLVARLVFRPWSWVPRRLGLGIADDTRETFRRLLTRRELFVADRGHDPDKPEPTYGRIVQAFVQGTVYRGLLFLLLPSLIAFVLPADYVTLFTVPAFLFSALIVTWGSMTSRWERLILHLQRWFMTGTALVISVLVVVIALLRIVGFQYVTTLLDAAPFGVLFGAVLMSYVLSWFAEYWINRLAALELLRVLGAGGADKLQYDLAGADPAIRVDPERRHLISHGIGRFLVVGSLLEEIPAAGGGSTLRRALSDRQPAFHSYDLLGVFRTLARPEDHDRVRDVGRHLELYFYAVNLLLIVTLIGFGVLHFRRADSLRVDTVVTARTPAAPDALVDLSRALAAADETARPAVVVVASGGGTRAAVYAAHVLEGLHRLGVDRDIVLTSGVSGGGVALAYFAAHYRALRDDADGAGWRQFRAKVSEPFIQDVLAGASEWRIFGTAPLTKLLAESFDRRLFERRREGGTPVRFAALADAPALILNTTVVGHPAGESQLLAATLNPAGAGPAEPTQELCHRPYRMMNGGRLIFTNLRNTDLFPRRGAGIPDTRLPYEIVSDGGVSVARAAALNANFPPVFPNARVTVTAREQATPFDRECPERSYFVTDGGAEENLGLVSALFAVRSALADLEKACGEGGRGPTCPRRLRPIHFVIAEASAASYDYDQDRGMSAALGGAKERLTGGLVEELRRQTDDLYRRLAGPGAVDGPHFHYLALPLVFRARGGFGTHWMHANWITMHDPRLRVTPSWWERPFDPFAERSVTVSREQLGKLWIALHDPGTEFCSTEFEVVASNTVRRWICGDSRDGARARDIHIEQWRGLVERLGSAARPRP